MAPTDISWVGIPLEFFLFGLTLLGIAIMHQRAFEVALAGLIVIVIYKVAAQDLNLFVHLQHEWSLLLNLFGLLLGFAILARHFEESRLPEFVLRRLPQGWNGGFVLLALTWLISVFLDNIAAAIIGGVIAKQVFNNRVSVSYIAALVAAANAGGAGSVIGDTTTTMMWIAGVPALQVAHAFIASTVALVFSGVIASRFQHRWQPIQNQPDRDEKTLIYTRLGIVAFIIGGVIVSNVLLHFPAAGAWIAILLAGLLHPIPWKEAGRALKGSLFLVALVLAASLMPVKALPDPSWQTVFGLGWLSAVFDNIPLTALALKQGGYDWGQLAFAVGYGGSMIWFGSSAGVAICNIFPAGKNTLRWIKEGWHVAAAYILGFFSMLWIMGWHPLHIP